MINIQLSRGLSLIEVLVTIIITSIGLMGLVSLQMQAVRATSDSGSHSQAIWVINDMVSRIHANEDASSNYETNGVYLCGAAPTVCSTYHTGTVLVPAVAACSGAQMAAWDLYEVACGSPKADSADGSVLFHGNSIDYLPNAQFTITCNSNPCADGISSFTVMLQWREKADRESITGAARTANSGLLNITYTDVSP